MFLVGQPCPRTQGEEAPASPIFLDPIRTTYSDESGVFLGSATPIPIGRGPQHPQILLGPLPMPKLLDVERQIFL